MDIQQGFQIEDPNVFVTWDVSEGELARSLGPRLRHVTTGYWTVSCRSLGGMQHELGFHFRRRRFKRRLAELEFFRRSYPDQRRSYDEFQHRFEEAFGTPTFTIEGDAEYPMHEWHMNGIKIFHSVVDRFVLAEYMRIQRIDRL